MATTKKTAATKAAAEKETAAKETVKKTTKVVTEKKEEAPVKKAPAKKAPAKKAAPKKVAPKKPETQVAETKSETNVKVFVEFAGGQESMDKLVENAKIVIGKPVKEMEIYLKPSERKAYIVADGETKDMDVFFC